MIIASYIAAMIALAYGAFLQLQIIQNEKQANKQFGTLCDIVSRQEAEINKIKRDKEAEE